MDTILFLFFFRFSFIARNPIWLGLFFETDREFLSERQVLVLVQTAIPMQMYPKGIVHFKQMRPTSPKATCSREQFQWISLFVRVPYHGLRSTLRRRLHAPLVFFLCFFFYYSSLFSFPFIFSMYTCLLLNLNFMCKNGSFFLGGK